MFYCANVIAQDDIKIISPPDGGSTPTAFFQEVTVEWIDGDSPVRADVTLTTTLGHILVPTVKTDDFGLATFIVISIEAGEATLAASGEMQSSSIELEFVTLTPDSDLNDRVPVRPPFGESGVLRRDEHGTRFWLAKDRIGFLAGDSFTLSDLDDFIVNNDVIKVMPLSDRVFALQFDDRSRVRPLRELARELEQIGEAGQIQLRPIRKAGLVAMLDGRDQTFIAPDEIMVKFVDVPSDGVKDAFKLTYGLTTMEQLGRNPKRFIAAIDLAQVKDPITLATEIFADNLIELADPSFVIVRKQRSTSTEEPGFNLQWYHENVGDYAQVDADIDSAGAWQFTEGDHNIMIAVIDSGFDIHHPDLIDNLDPADPTIFAIDLADADTTDLLHSSFGMEAFGHGTRAAGVAAARGGNGKGYAGTCPLCQLLLIRVPDQDPEFVKALDQAVDRGAEIISNSWGWDYPSDALVDTMNEAVADGVTVLMAMTNEEIDNCGLIPDTSSPPAVIAVSGITDYDRRSSYPAEALGYGTCMDVLAPTRGGAKGIHTTSVEMTTAGKLATYWHDFSGTSAATPMVAGVVGLLKTLDGSLSPLQIQRILQDTADRVDPANANYDKEFGFGDPGGTPKHGYGRINSFEATRLVAPLVPVGDSPPGRGGKDLFLRDNPLDWGNTEQPSDTIFDSPRGQDTEYRSVDIKIDVDPFDAIVTSPEEFAALQSDEPEVGKPARVYVRTRNRGPNTIANANLKLHAAIVDDTFPDLPADFWANFPADSGTTNVWKPIGVKALTNVAYSGASIAGCPDRSPMCHPDSAVTVTDAASIEMFDLSPMDWDGAANQRLALLVAIDSGEDTLQGKLTPDVSFNDVLTAVHMDNNVTLWVSGETAIGPGPRVPNAWLIVLVVLAILLSL